MYPVNSKIATSVADKISSLGTMIGGSESCLRVKIAALTASFLKIPTGIARTDFSNARSRFVVSPAATLEDDAQTLNTLLDGTASGSAVQARIGNPTVNSTSSNLTAVIGGEGDIASCLGDPMLGDTGLSALITASNASNDHGIFNDLSSMQNATNISDQLSAFLALFGNLSEGATSVTFDFSGGVPASLADFVSRAVSAGGLA